MRHVSAAPRRERSRSCTGPPKTIARRCGYLHFHHACSSCSKRSALHLGSLLTSPSCTMSPFGCFARSGRRAFPSTASSFGSAPQPTTSGRRAFLPSCQPGRTHEAVGEALLLAAGFAPNAARFARTHGLAPDDPSLTLEDLLVQAADTLWKGKRDHGLEAVIVRHFGEPAWKHFLTWDEIAERLTADATDRLEWQRRFPP